MDFGHHNKLWQARRIAVTLGAIALLHSDVVGVYGLGGEGIQAGEWLDAPSMVGILSRQVASLRMAPQTDLPRSVRAYRAVRHRADLVVLLSDGLVEPTALEQALAELAEGTPSVAFLHVMDASELQAPSEGQLELRDSETDDVLELTVSKRAAASYAQLVEGFRVGIQRSVRAVDGRYLFAPTDLEPLELLAAGVRGEALVRA